MENKEQQRKTIAIDFDGVIHDWKGVWQGENAFDIPVEGAKEYIDMIIDELGYTVIIYTCRNNIQGVAEWLKQYNIRYHYINENPHAPKECCKRKIYADMYLDDRAVHFTRWDQAIALVTIRDRDLFGKINAEQMEDLELAAQYGMWECFWCEYEQGRNFVREIPILCNVKKKQFPSSYKCKKAFKLKEEVKQRLIGIEKMGENEKIIEKYQAK